MFYYLNTTNNRIKTSICCWYFAFWRWKNETINITKIWKGKENLKWKLKKHGYFNPIPGGEVSENHIPGDVPANRTARVRLGYSTHLDKIDDKIRCWSISLSLRRYTFQSTIYWWCWNRFKNCCCNKQVQSNE